MSAKQIRATERANILIGCYRRGDAADPEIYTRAVVAVLMRYPESVVLEVTEPASGLPSRLKWLPSIAELVDACENSRAMRAEIRDRVAQNARLGLPEPRQRTPEQQAQADRQVENWRRAKLGLFGSSKAEKPP